MPPRPYRTGLQPSPLRSSRSAWWQQHPDGFVGRPKLLYGPGEAPGGPEGDFTELLEDVLRDLQDEDPQWFKDQQRSKSWIERRQREMRRKIRERELQERQEHLGRLELEDQEQDEAPERQ